MDVFILLKLFCSIILLTTTSAAANNCTSAKCSLSSPDIRFPFRIQDRQPPQCGVPDFNLFCRQNTTMIHIPSYGDLVVKSISYDARRLSLLDPKTCVYEVFLNLNLSITPFSYYYAVQQYKYINCSAKIVGSSERVPCLSGSDHHVYIVGSSVPVPDSCSFLRTVAIPFSYSPYLSADSSFGLGFTWKLVEEEEATCSGCVLGILCSTRRLEKCFKDMYAVSGIIAFVFMVGVLFYATLSKYHKESHEEKGKGNV